MRTRTYPSIVEPLPEQTVTRRDPARPVAYALIAVIVLLAIVLFIYWRSGRNPPAYPSLADYMLAGDFVPPADYLRYTEKEDPYKDNQQVKAARRLYHLRQDLGCANVIVEPIPDAEYVFRAYCKGE